MARFLLIWTFMAAFLAALAAPKAFSASASNFVEDIQLGERGLQTRIAFLCKENCALEKRGRSYFLPGVEASFDLDFSGRSERVTRLVATPGQSGADVRVLTEGDIDYANVKSCRLGERQAACLDLFFRDPDADASLAPSIHSDAAAAKAKRVEEAVVEPDAAGALREAAPDRLRIYAKLAPPERLAPPGGANLAKIQPVDPTPDQLVAAADPAAPASGEGDAFRQRINKILDKDLTFPFCRDAQAALQADAWALGAMGDVGLCAAARGAFAEADSMLARLLEFTPDNYEALVGRAVIAEIASEKGVAKKYYQDALNALPPITESNRILTAVSEL